MRKGGCKPCGKLFGQNLSIHFANPWLPPTLGRCLGQVPSMQSITISCLKLIIFESSKCAQLCVLCSIQLQTWSLSLRIACPCLRKTRIRTFPCCFCAWFLDILRSNRCIGTSVAWLHWWILYGNQMQRLDLYVLIRVSLYAIVWSNHSPLSWISSLGASSILMKAVRPQELSKSWIFVSTIH